MKKRNLIIILSVVAVLIIVTGVAALLNAGNVKEKKELQKDAVIIFNIGDEEIARADMEYIVGLGEEEFSAVKDTSDTGPDSVKYSGVPLIKIINSLDINIRDMDTVIVKAIDGYTVAIDKEDVLDETNVYVAFKYNGESLGSKTTGGTGPYQIIITKDEFSQRWCKFVSEIEFK